MKTHSFLPVLFVPLVLFVLLPPAPAQDTPPETQAYNPTEYQIDRYQKILGKSPFEFELAKPQAEATADPFLDLVLSSFVGSGDRMIVYVVNTKTQERIPIYGDGIGHKNATGFRIIKLNRGAMLSTTTVTLEKDGQQHDLAIDTAALWSMTGGAGGGGAPGQPNPGQPNVPGQPNTVIRPNFGGRNGGASAQPAQQTKFIAPQAFIPGSGSQGGGQLGRAAATQTGFAGGGVTAGGQAPAAFIPGSSGGNAIAAAAPASATQNQPITPDNTVRSVEQQQHINALLDGSITQPGPPSRRRVVLPTPGR